MRKQPSNNLKKDKQADTIRLRNPYLSPFITKKLSARKIKGVYDDLDGLIYMEEFYGRTSNHGIDISISIRPPPGHYDSISRHCNTRRNDISLPRNSIYYGEPKQA